MIKILIILVLSIVIASLLFSILKKMVKTALFIGMVIIVFLIISSIILPETNYFEKGKNYILGKSESMLEEGKDKLTSYVIKEGNETVSKAKNKIITIID